MDDTLNAIEVKSLKWGEVMGSKCVFKSLPAPGTGNQLLFSFSSMRSMALIPVRLVLSSWLGLLHTPSPPLSLASSLIKDLARHV